MQGFQGKIGQWLSLLCHMFFVLPRCLFLPGVQTGGKLGCKLTFVQTSRAATSMSLQDVQSGRTDQETEARCAALHLLGKAYSIMTGGVYVH